MKLWWMGLLLQGIALGATAPKTPLTGPEILRRAEAIRSPEGDISFSVQAKDYISGKLSRTTIYKVFSKPPNYSMVETTFPERMQGRKLLMKENGLWLYLPTINRPTRVSFQQKLTGEVSNGDIARTSFYDDYNAELLGFGKLKKKTCYRLSLTAKNNEVTYRRVLMWVERGTFRPLKAEFFAISGKLLKTGDFSGFKPVLGKSRPTRLEIRDALQPGLSTQLQYDRFKRESLSESFFNKDSMVN